MIRSFLPDYFRQKHKYIEREIKKPYKCRAFLEVSSGFEPEYTVLQTGA